MPIVRTCSVSRLFAAACSLGLMLSPDDARAESWRWVQYVPGGVEVRVVTSGGACPALSIDGSESPMPVRSEPGDGYPVRVCASLLPPGAQRASIGGLPLPLPRPEPNRILIVGDTGCRLKDKIVQACNDSAAWPFKLGATLSATLKPDLVLHVGDFHYRETACPTGNDGCAGSPSGDVWDAWREDFFTPAESLLRAAPWIMVRGNHEACDRGGQGWARALDPYPFDPATGKAGCLPPGKPYMVAIKGVTIEVMDVSSAAEPEVDEAQVAGFRDAFALAKSIAGPVWQAFHRPVWASNGHTGKAKQGDNKTLAAAARDSVPGNVQAFISGHIHTFQVMSYVEDLPIQIVSGHGGDELAVKAPDTVQGLAINGVTVKEGIARAGVFGFSVLERTPGDPSGTWTLTGYDIYGHALGYCRLIGRSLACR